MATYTLSPKYKKSIEEVFYWTKDDQTVIYRQGWRGGSYSCDSTVPPDIDLKNPDGLDVYCADAGDSGGWELDEVWDGCWDDWEFPEDMSEEECDRLKELWYEDFWSAFENDGWVNMESECWFTGELELTCDGETVVTTEDDPNAQAIARFHAMALTELSEAPPTVGAWPFPMEKL